jgi:tetratricopeptide (TPR) repeat protein
MSMSASTLSDDFQRLYCDASVFDVYSAWHPINLRRVLPFQAQDRIMDEPPLLEAEAAHLADRNNDTRLAVVDAYAACALLSPEDAANLRPVLDYYDAESSAEFFDLMGLAYANAGMYLCALRWYREHIAAVETRNSKISSDDESVYASVGYCLYAMGMFEEAIAWTKSCIGPLALADVGARALLDYEARKAGGGLFSIERSAGRARYTIRATDPGNARQIVQQLKQAIEALGSVREAYVDWRAGTDTSLPQAQIEEGYPFRLERYCASFMRHKMNLLFATCGRADVLIADGCVAEARRLLEEAALIEPQADFIQERLGALRAFKI